MLQNRPPRLAALVEVANAPVIPQYRGKHRASGRAKDSNRPVATVMDVDSDVSLIAKTVDERQPA